MTDIYVIVASGGQYDDAWQSNIGYCTSMEQAEVLKDRLVCENKRDVELHRKIQKLKGEIFKLGPIVYEKPIDLPKWKNGLGIDQITDAMKNERSSIMIKNQIIAAHNEEKCTAYNNMVDDKIIEMLVAENVPNDRHQTYLGYNWLGDASYSIEPLGLIS